MSPERRRPVRRTGQDESGQISLLVLGYTLISLSFVAVAVDASAVHLARTQLLDAADAAALNAADAVDEGQLYARGVTERLPLSDESVREQATRYLSTYQAPSRLSEVALSGTSGSADGSSATVELSGRVHVPIAASVVAAWSGGITVTVTSTARSALAP